MANNETALGDVLQIDVAAYLLQREQAVGQGQHIQDVIVPFCQEDVGGGAIFADLYQCFLMRRQAGDTAIAVLTCSNAGRIRDVLRAAPGNPDTPAE